MEPFKSCEQFSEWLQAQDSPVLEFSSTPKRLRMWQSHLHALASGDFNPHYCRPDFAEISFFGGIVSHGIGIINRAEAQFTKLLLKCFEGPIEVIALGYEDIRYLSPLRLGERYRYRFKVTNPRLRRGRWDLECHFVCEVLGPNARVVAEADWKPSLIEHPATEDAKWNLRPKSYAQNLLEIFVMPTVQKGVLGLFACIGVVAIVFAIMAMTGKVDLSTLNDSLNGFNGAAAP